MNALSAIEFLVIAATVVATAWEPRPAIVIRVLGVLQIRYSTFFGAVWISIVTSFWWLFGRMSESLPLLAVLAELAGIIYLAREVYIAQEFEEYKRFTEVGIWPFVELEALADQRKYEEYVYKYYELSGRTRDEADADMSVAKMFGTLEVQVDRLRAQARQTFDRPMGLLAVEVFRGRRHRLIRGVVLVSVGLAGHGLHLLIRP